MAQAADRHLTPEQERVRRVKERYAHMALWVTGGVLAAGALYLGALYLLSVSSQ